MRRVSSSCSDPIAHTTSFINALLQNLTVLILFVEHQLIMIFWGVKLTELIPNAQLAEHAFHTKGTGFIWNNRNDSLT